jgi:molybdopterin synthase catalytic subunit
MKVKAELTHETIDVTCIIKEFHFPNCGAVSTFLGTTRDRFEDKRVVELAYEAYKPMAIKIMTQLCTTIGEKYGLVGIGIVHRLGIVPVLEDSVLIITASPHRKESLDALEELLEEVKHKVPIFKKEVYTDGSSWKHNKESIV